MTASITAVRSAVKRALHDLPVDRPVIVACSGGADSMALAAATAWEGQRSGRPVMAVIVDHALVAGSTGVANEAAATCADLGLDPVVVRRVDARAFPGGDGPEAAARHARRHALQQAADEVGAPAVLLGHTLDDQAETVVLQLSRGSGARSLSGMRPVSGVFRRPLLELTRAVVRRSAEEQGLVVHEDPWNTDPRFARSRVRATVLPIWEAEIGPGVAQALARTADLVRDDADYLDQVAADLLATLTVDGPPTVADLRRTPRALRTRVIRTLVIDAGCAAGTLARLHISAIDRLVMEPRTTGPIHLPSGFTAHRRCGRLVVEPPASSVLLAPADKEC